MTVINDLYISIFSGTLGLKPDQGALTNLKEIKFGIILFVFFQVPTVKYLQILKTATY